MEKSIYISDRYVANYYHFMMLMLTQLRTLDFVPDTIYIEHKNIRYVLEILSMLFPNSRIISAIECPQGCLSKPSHFDLTLDDHDKNIKEYTFLINLFNPHIKSYIPNKNYSKKIYISRSDTARRRIENETEIVDLLTNNGFENIVLSKLSQIESMYIFSNADIIIGGHGANLTNLIFCKPGTRVIEITTEQWAYVCRNFQLISLELAHIFFTYTTIVEDSYDPVCRSIRVNNPAALLNYI